MRLFSFQFKTEITWNCFKNPPPPLFENNYLCWHVDVWPAQMLTLAFESIGDGFVQMPFNRLNFLYD